MRMRVNMLVRLAFAVLAAASVLPTLGCEMRLPQFPTPVEGPGVVVSRVDLVAANEQASRYDLVVTLTNPNDVALPLTGSDYTLTVNGASYTGDNLPNATLPAEGSVTVALPAAVTAAAGNRYEARGSIEYFPPGQIKRLFYDMGIPKPRASFMGSGAVQPKPPEEKPPERKGRVESDPPPTP